MDVPFHQVGTPTGTTQAAPERLFPSRNLAFVEPGHEVSAAADGSSRHCVFFDVAAGACVRRPCLGQRAAYLCALGSKTTSTPFDKRRRFCT